MTRCIVHLDLAEAGAAKTLALAPNQSNRFVKKPALAILPSSIVAGAYAALSPVVSPATAAVGDEGSNRQSCPEPWAGYQLLTSIVYSDHPDVPLFGCIHVDTQNLPVRPNLQVSLRLPPC